MFSISGALNPTLFNLLSPQANPHRPVMYASSKNTNGIDFDCSNKQSEDNLGIRYPDPLRKCGKCR